jgi:hypothetical protein
MNLESIVTREREGGDGNNNIHMLPVGLYAPYSVPGQVSSMLEKVKVVVYFVCDG